MHDLRRDAFEHYKPIAATMGLIAVRDFAMTAYTLKIAELYHAKAANNNTLELSPRCWLTAVLA